MNAIYFNPISETLAAQALRIDGMTPSDYPQLGQLIGEFLSHNAPVKLSYEAGTYFVQSTRNAFVFAAEPTAVRAWIEAHDSYTPCAVLD